MAGFLQRCGRLLRHRWFDPGDLRRAMPPALVRTLAARVAASERRHTGQIRLSVEAGLPASYIWRDVGARERALTLFGKLRVWDTEHNNGVLVYVLLADHAIEIVADRGLNRFIDPHHWQHLVARMGDAFASGRYEDGLTEALEEISALLVEHFPAGEGVAHPNELPDAPVLFERRGREAL